MQARRTADQAARGSERRALPGMGCPPFPRHAGLLAGRAGLAKGALPPAGADAPAPSEARSPAPPGGGVLAPVGRRLRGPAKAAQVRPQGGSCQALRSFPCWLTPSQEGDALKRPVGVMAGVLPCRHVAASPVFPGLRPVPARTEGDGRSSVPGERIGSGLSSDSKASPGVKQKKTPHLRGSAAPFARDL